MIGKVSAATTTVLVLLAVAIGLLTGAVSASADTESESARKPSNSGNVESRPHVRRVPSTTDSETSADHQTPKDRDPHGSGRRGAGTHVGDTRDAASDPDSQRDDVPTAAKYHNPDSAGDTAGNEPAQQAESPAAEELTDDDSTTRAPAGSEAGADEAASGDTEEPRPETPSQTDAATSTPASLPAARDSTPPADSPDGTGPVEVTKSSGAPPADAQTSETSASGTAHIVDTLESPDSGSATEVVSSANTGDPSPVSVTAPEALTRSAVTLNDQTVTPRRPTVVDLIGSVVLNLLMGLIHAVDGPPVLPAQSTVTVRTSTLKLSVAGGRTVEANWYFPHTDAEPTGLIFLQHGFGASAPMYSYTAAALAEQTNSIVVVPSLSSNFFDRDAAWLGGTPMQRAVADLFIGDRDALTASSQAAGYDGTLPTRVVLAGHSMGGALVMGAASYMVDSGAVEDLVGVLLLDAVDVNDAVPTALEKLTGTNFRPVLNISSERYVWNMYGKVADQLQAARPEQFNGVMLVGGRHIDAGQGGNWLLQQAQYLLAGSSQPRNIEATQTLAVGWVNDMFASTREGIYGAPQQTIQIATTAAGTATAIALPFTSTDTVWATPHDWVSASILTALQHFFIYEPLTGA